MALYRIYKVDADDHIADADNIECAGQTGRLRTISHRGHSTQRKDAGGHADGVGGRGTRNDEEACAKALQMQGAYPAVEVWEGARRVARMGAG
jgi:hypothetical protein